MKVSRRAFLQTGGVAAVGIGLLPGFLSRAAAAVASTGKKLVVVFQRGAADGLNIVVPHAERSYYKLRPSIAIPRPRGSDPKSAIDLDGFFGFHPKLAPLKSFYDEGRLAVIHAAGSPDTTRSHFDAQDFMESGTPGVKSTADGWLNRALDVAAVERPSSFRAVSVTQNLPRILTGSEPALAIASLDRFGLDGGPFMQLARSGLEAMYRTSGDTRLAFAAQETFEAVDIVDGMGGSRPARGVQYPRGEFGEAMKQAARLVKSDVGLQVAFADVGGWDHHVNEGRSEGPLANLLQQYAAALVAFTRDIESHLHEVVLVTLSEFGRTVSENGNRGTDHGHANAYFVLGGPVRGGAVYGDWPGLDKGELFEGRDLAVTTDFRDVMAEILVRHLGVADLAGVFPGYPAQPASFRGLLRA